VCGEGDDEQGVASRAEWEVCDGMVREQAEGWSVIGRNGEWRGVRSAGWRSVAAPSVASAGAAGAAAAAAAGTAAAAAAGSAAGGAPAAAGSAVGAGAAVAAAAAAPGAARRLARACSPTHSTCRAPAPAVSPLAAAAAAAGWTVAVEETTHPLLHPWACAPCCSRHPCSSPTCRRFPPHQHRPGLAALAGLARSACEHPPGPV